MAERFDQLKESAQIDNFLAKTSQVGKPSDRQLGGPSRQAEREVAPAAFQQQRR